MKAIPILSVALAVLAACASAPRIDYYTLGTTSPAVGEAAVNITVERLRTTPALSRRQIMVSTSATHIEYYATDHWVGGVGELVRQRLAAAFGTVVAGRRTVELSGNVLACGQVDGPAGPQAHVKLEIAFREGGTPLYRPPLLVRTYEATRPVAGSGVSALVDELATGIDQIASEIARDAASLPAGDGG